MWAGPRVRSMLYNYGVQISLSFTPQSTFSYPVGKRAKSAKGAKHTNTTTQCWRTWRVHRTIYWERGYANLSKVLQGFLSRPRNNFKKNTTTFNGGKQFLAVMHSILWGNILRGNELEKKVRPRKTNKIRYFSKGPEIYPEIDFLSTSSRKKLHKENTGS